MNRRDLFSKALVGLAVTPAAVKAVTESRPKTLLDLINEMPPADGPASMTELFNAVYAIKRERDAEPPKDYIEIMIHGPDAKETAMRLQQMFRSYHRVQRVTDDGYERWMKDCLKEWS